MLDNFIRVRRHAFFRNDNRMHRLAPFVIRNADYRNCGTASWVEMALSTSAENVPAAGDNHVFHGHDKDEAVIVHITAIARMHPAIDQRGGGLLV